MDISPKLRKEYRKMLRVTAESISSAATSAIAPYTTALLESKIMSKREICLMLCKCFATLATGCLYEAYAKELGDEQYEKEQQEFFSRIWKEFVDARKDLEDRFGE